MHLVLSFHILHILGKTIPAIDYLKIKCEEIGIFIYLSSIGIITGSLISGRILDKLAVN